MLYPTGSSLEEFQWLLNASSEASVHRGCESVLSTVTAWGTDSLTDEELEQLRKFIKVIGRQRCFTDTTANVCMNVEQCK